MLIGSLLSNADRVTGRRQRRVASSLVKVSVEGEDPVKCQVVRGCPGEDDAFPLA